MRYDLNSMAIEADPFSRLTLRGMRHDLDLTAIEADPFSF